MTPTRREGPVSTARERTTKFRSNRLDYRSATAFGSNCDTLFCQTRNARSELRSTSDSRRTNARTTARHVENVPTALAVAYLYSDTGIETYYIFGKDGRLDVALLVRTLRDLEYDGALTVEYIDSFDGVDPETAEEQAAVLRDLLARLV